MGIPTFKQLTEPEDMLAWAAQEKRERLRDEMAMAALSGIASMHGLNVSLESSLIATCCYEVADAMLKAREAK